MLYEPPGALAHLQKYWFVAAILAIFEHRYRQKPSPSSPFHGALCNIRYSFSFQSPLCCYWELSRVIFHDFYPLSSSSFPRFSPRSCRNRNEVVRRVTFFYWVFQRGLSITMIIRVEEGFFTMIILLLYKKKKGRGDEISRCYAVIPQRTETPPYIIMK